jgi:hypothetical protein
MMASSGRASSSDDTTIASLTRSSSVTMSVAVDLVLTPGTPSARRARTASPAARATRSARSASSARSGRTG